MPLIRSWCEIKIEKFLTKLRIGDQGCWYIFGQSFLQKNMKNRKQSHLQDSNSCEILKNVNSSTFSEGRTIIFRGFSPPSAVLFRPSVLLAIHFGRFISRRSFFLLGHSPKTIVSFKCEPRKWSKWGRRGEKRQSSHFLGSLSSCKTTIPPVTFTKKSLSFPHLICLAIDVKIYLTHLQRNSNFFLGIKSLPCIFTFLSSTNRLGEYLQIFKPISITFKLRHPSKNMFPANGNQATCRSVRTESLQNGQRLF